MKQGFFVALITLVIENFSCPLGVLIDLRCLFFCHLSGNLTKLRIIIDLNNVQF